LTDETKKAALMKNFDQSRVIGPQRVCAHEMPNGNIRVFYKINQQNIRSSIYLDRYWAVEEFMIPVGATGPQGTT
jgi:hypothetical protein